MKNNILKRILIFCLGVIVFIFALGLGACDGAGSSSEGEYTPPEFIVGDDETGNGDTESPSSGNQGTSGSSVKYTPAKNWGSFEVYKKTFGRIGDDVMPIGGFSGPFQPKSPSYNGQVQPDFLDDYYWELFSDCGVNNIMFTRNEYREDTAAVMRALDQAEKHNMLFFVRDQQLKRENYNEATFSKFYDVVKDYIDHPACAGIYGIDEPVASEFEGLKGLKSTFDSMNFDDREVYINMLPNYAGANSFGSYGTYEGYLRGYMNTVGMPYLMYDYYPFVMNADALDLDKNTRIIPYFQNIATVRKVANDFKVPFWAFVQAGGQWEGESGVPKATEYPLFPSESSFLWNINTLLAYGMKGMAYFDLIQDPILEELNIAETPGGGRDYTRFGIVGGLGNINQWYYYAVKAATQIQAIDQVLLNSSNQGIMAVGSRAYMLGEGEEIIGGSSWRELVGLDAENAILGCFDYQGRTALYVVNNSFDQKQKITLKFDDKYGYDVTQRGQKVSVATDKLQLTVEAGEGVLVVLRAQ